MNLSFSPMPPIQSTDALLVIDVQKDFLPTGALPVPEGDKVIEPINKLVPQFPLVVATQDWHPKDHSSFRTASPPGPWPPHCIQGTEGADFAEGLDTARFHCILRKGTHREVDSYSAFWDNQRRYSTGLEGLLQALHIQRVFVVGLALDFCVRYSAQDARELGFETFVIWEACRPVNVENSLEETLGAFREQRIHLCSLEEV